jgi:hypothetical protein
MLAGTGIAGFSVSMVICSLANLWLWLAVLISLVVGVGAAWATNNAWHEMNYTTSRVMEARRDRQEVAGETADA